MLRCAKEDLEFKEQDEEPPIGKGERGVVDGGGVGSGDKEGLLAMAASFSTVLVSSVSLLTPSSSLLLFVIIVVVVADTGKGVD